MSGSSWIFANLFHATWVTWEAVLIEVFPGLDLSDSHCIAPLPQSFLMFSSPACQHWSKVIVKLLWKDFTVISLALWDILRTLTLNLNPQTVYSFIMEVGSNLKWGHCYFFLNWLMHFKNIVICYLGKKTSDFENVYTVPYIMYVEELNLKAHCLILISGIRY